VAHAPQPVQREVENHLGSSSSLPVGYRGSRARGGRVLRGTDYWPPAPLSVLLTRMVFPPCESSKLGLTPRETGDAVAADQCVSTSAVNLVFGLLLARARA
jgi:hypothetical protein